MKTYYKLGLGFLMLLLTWIALISYFNSRTTTMQIHISESIDEVRFYEDGQPNMPIATIQPHGEFISTSLELRNSAHPIFFLTGAPTQYYYVAYKQGAVYRSSPVCCSTSIQNQVGYLTIRDLGEWEQQHP